MRISARMPPTTPTTIPRVGGELVDLSAAVEEELRSDVSEKDDVEV